MSINPTLQLVPFTSVKMLNETIKLMVYDGAVADLNSSKEK